MFWQCSRRVTGAQILSAAPSYGEDEVIVRTDWRQGDFSSSGVRVRLGFSTSVMNSGTIDGRRRRVDNATSGQQGAAMSSDIGVLTKLPDELQYLIEPAMKYGVFQSHDDIVRFFQTVTDTDREMLSSVADKIRVNGHLDSIEGFLDQYEMTQYPESAKLYFLFGILDEMGLKFERPDWNTVERHIESLGRFGSFRLASKRMWAARFLVDFGQEARKAIPRLRQALDDEDLRVQVWAHYALAVIEGGRAEHERAIKAIFAKHDQRDELDVYDEIGSEAEAALEKLREL